MLIFKASILRIPFMEMSEPHSNAEKRFGYVRKFWFSDLRNDHDQDPILFCQTIPYTIFIPTWRC